MIDGDFCADLHVHSCHSDEIRPEWFFRQMGVAECYTPPSQVYALAKSRGMDYVTITDHDTIDGALEIAHMEGAFLGVEISTRFPEERGTIDVVALGLTEAQYRDIRAHQANIYDLVAYLNQSKILHYLAHPFYSGEAHLTPGGLEKLFLLFKTMEGLNGARSARQRDLLARILRDLTPDRIAEWANRHGLEPVGAEPHRKALVGGSDDHAGLTVARGYTACPDARTPQAFLEAIRQGLSRPGGETGTALSMATNAYGIAYGYFQKHPEPAGNVYTSFFGSFWPRPERGHAPSHLEKVFRKKLPRIFAGHPALTPAGLRASSHRGSSQRAFFEGINRVFNQILGESCLALASDLRSLSLERLFHSLGQIASAHFFLSAYYGAFSYQSGDRPYLEAMSQHFGASSVLARPRKIAIFSDWVHGGNGVALGLRGMMETARATGRSMILMSCSDRPAGMRDGVLNFPAVARFPLPHNPELSFCIPPLLDMLDRCEREEVTAVQLSTPGPVGLAGLLIATLLGLPTVGFYPATLPGLLREVIGGSSLEGLAQAGIAWFYRKMDTVFVTSRESFDELAAMGVDPGKLQMAPHVVDPGVSHPSRRWEGTFLKRPPGEVARPSAGSRGQREAFDRVWEMYP